MFPNPYCDGFLSDLLVETTQVRALFDINRRLANELLSYIWPLKS